MPIYTFRDINTDEVFDIMISLSDYDEYKEKHPHHERYIDSAPSIVSGVSLSDKRGDGFKEVMSKISEAHPHSPLADTYGRRDSKQAKTQRAIQKWRGSGN